MPRRNPDLLDQHIRVREDARRSRLYRPAHSETKTFLVGGDIVAGIKIPPFIVAMTPSFSSGSVTNDRDPQETKLLKAYCGSVESGSASIRPKKNGAYIGAAITVSPTKPTHWVRVDALAEGLADRDRLTFDVVSASAAKDLAAAFVFEVRPGTMTEGASDILG